MDREAIEDGRQHLDLGVAKVLGRRRLAPHIENQPATVGLESLQAVYQHWLQSTQHLELLDGPNMHDG